jgi:hypothetical protein
MALFKRLKDPVAARITHADTMRELSLALAAPLLDHHVALALNRWYEIAAAFEEDTRDMSAPALLEVIIANATTPQQVAAACLLGRSTLHGKCLSDALMNNGRPPLVLASQLPAHIAAGALEARLASSSYNNNFTGLSDLLSKFKASHADLRDLFGQLGRVCALAEPEMTFDELLILLESARSANPEHLGIVFALVSQECGSSTDAIDALSATRCVEGLRLLADRPDLVAHAYVLRRSGAPGPLLSLMEAALALVDGAGMSFPTEQLVTQSH